MKLTKRFAYIVFFFSISHLVYGQGEFPERLPHQISVIAWSPQGDLYAMAYINGDIQIYSNNILTNTITNAHSRPIRDLAFSPSNNRLATGGEDDDVRIWNVVTGELVGEVLDIGEIVDAVNWSSDSTIIWASSLTGPEHIISANIATDSYVVSQIMYLEPSADISWKHNSSVGAIGLRTMDVAIVDTLNYSVRKLDATPDTYFFEPPTEFTTSVAWHPTANIIANGKINGWIHIWDLDSPSDTVPMLSLEANNGVTDHALIPFEYTVIDIEFSNDGSTIKSVSRDGTIRIWNAETGELLSELNLGEAVLAGAFSPDANTLVYSTYSPEDEPPTVIGFTESN